VALGKSWQGFSWNSGDRCFTNADDTQLLAELHCREESRTPQQQFAADFRTALPEACGIVFFEARGRTAEAREIYNGSRSVVLTILLMRRECFLPGQRRGIFQVNRHLAEELVTSLLEAKPRA